MKVVVGIGNPGKEYQDTRHNVGFDVVDRLAGADDVEISKRRFDALLGEGTIAQVRVVLVKPQTYVNNSGLSVRQVLEWYKLPVEALLVVCDDANLPLGRLRFRADGSGGGHHGLESIAAHLGTEAFARLRIGIDRKAQDLVEHVLGRFSRAERRVMEETYVDALRGVTRWVSSDIQTCMNEFSG